MQPEPEVGVRVNIPQNDVRPGSAQGGAQAQPDRPMEGARGDNVGDTGRNQRNKSNGRGEPDLEEKFGRFEIKPPIRTLSGAQVSGLGGLTLGSEQGDETFSMVSDTWSTDVLASDTEAASGGEVSDVLMLMQQRNQQRIAMGIVDQSEAGVLGDLADIGAAAAVHSGAQRQSSASGGLVGGGGGSLYRLASGAGSGGNESRSGPSSAANLLDIAETASEAWSMDAILASDTESLRLGELDNEDAASVARSDDTRFTDDTTRRSLNKS